MVFPRRLSGQCSGQPEDRRIGVFAQARGDGSAGICPHVGLGHSTGGGVILYGRCAYSLRHDASMRPAGRPTKAFRGVEEARRGKRSGGRDRSPVLAGGANCLREGCSLRHGKRRPDPGRYPIVRHGWSCAGTVNAARRQPP